MNIIDNRGLAYGDGFFSTMGVYRGAILWFDYHLQRLQSHAHVLNLDIDIEAIISQLQSHAHDIDEGIIKIVITRANQAPYKIRGYGFATGNNGRQAEFFIKSIAQVMPHYHTISDNHPIPIYQASTQQPQQHHALCLNAQLAHLPQPLVGLKSLNCLDNVLIAGELEQAKANNPYLVEGLVTDVTGQWVEGVMSNVFYQLDDNSQWHTPPINNSGVNGVMRQVIINYYKNNGQTIIERDLTNNDLPSITGLFFTNAVKGVITIDKLWLSGGEFLDFNK